MLIVELKGFSFVLQAWLYHFPLLGPAHRNPRRHFQQHSLMAHIPEFTEKTWHFLKALSTYTTFLDLDRVSTLAVYGGSESSQIPSEIF